jgi:hypothetical protein
VEDIHTISPDDVLIKRSTSSNGFTMHASYRAEAPFIANVSLVAAFDKTVDVR